MIGEFLGRKRTTCKAFGMTMKPCKRSTRNAGPMRPLKRSVMLVSAALLRADSQESPPSLPLSKKGRCSMTSETGRQIFKIEYLCHGYTLITLRKAVDYQSVKPKRFLRLTTNVHSIMHALCAAICPLSFVSSSSNSAAQNQNSSRCDGSAPSLRRIPYVRF